MPIGGYDVILGIQWLSTLGNIFCNFQQLTIKFLWEGKQVHLSGIKTNILQVDEESFIQRESRNNQLCDMVVKGNETMALFGQEKDLEVVLSSFRDVFAEPNCLPPKRDCDHAILLQQGSNPVNLKAYKYANFQKDIIEKLVQDMLKNGIVRPSHSAFASLEVLVKKKDNTWRFCVD